MTNGDPFLSDIGTLSDSIVEGLPPPSNPIDMETRAAEFLRAAKRETAQLRFETYCPPKYVESDWNHPHLKPNAEAIRRVLTWKTDSRHGLLLSGVTGRGKTRALCGLWKRLACGDGLDVRYYHSTDWFSELEQQIKFGRDDARKFVEKVGRMPLVILDDLGQESVLKNKEEWAQAWFFRFLDIRLGEGLPLFVTTNLTAKDMAEDQKHMRADPLIRRLLAVCGEAIKFL